MSDKNDNEAPSAPDGTRTGEPGARGSPPGLPHGDKTVGDGGVGLEPRAMSVLDLRTFPHQPRAGSQVLPTTIENMRWLLDTARVTVRYDVIKKKLAIMVPGVRASPDNYDNVAMTHIVSIAALHGLQVGLVPTYVEAIADAHLWNPVADWIKSRPWDGIDRSPMVCDTLVEREDFPAHLKNVLLHRWLLSGVGTRRGRGMATPFTRPTGGAWGHLRGPRCRSTTRGHPPPAQFGWGVRWVRSAKPLTRIEKRGVYRP